MGQVKAICISEKRGTEKQNVGEANFVENYGIENDAHAGDWHRQVSLLCFDKVEDFRLRGAEVAEGAFGENILVEGIDFKTLPIGTVLTCNDVILEITQIGKKCHSHCEIYKRVGDCIMPREGVFAKVIHAGSIKMGDEMFVQSTFN
jgi:MOSC domain-containing protein YiiM